MSNILIVILCMEKKCLCAEKKLCPGRGGPDSEEIQDPMGDSWSQDIARSHGCVSKDKNPATNGPIVHAPVLYIRWQKMKMGMKIMKRPVSIKMKDTVLKKVVVLFSMGSVRMALVSLVVLFVKLTMQSLLLVVALRHVASLSV